MKRFEIVVNMYEYATLFNTYAPFEHCVKEVKRLTPHHKYLVVDLDTKDTEKMRRKYNTKITALLERTKRYAKEIADLNS